MSSKVEPAKKEIPEVIVDTKRNKSYRRGKFLGKGGFAKCYELTDLESGEIWAGKIVPKSLLVKPHQKEKMTQEIQIHKVLSHKHIVKFMSFFEDPDFVYILLELCRRRSLMELHKRRRAITEPETRYFVRQTLLAVKHLHDHKVIHRDLKLGNLFMNDEMDVKIGDFGLATRIDFDGERKRTLCGTPNYIAPEVLCKKGHSFEVDVWSLGCIVYTLLVGKPPFETSSLKDTYLRIKKNEYSLPSRLSPCAKSLVQRLLQSDPSNRPTVQQIIDDDFFTTGFMPVRLPTSCLTMAPRIDTLQRFDIAANAAQRRPFGEINGQGDQRGAMRPATAGLLPDKMKGMAVDVAPGPGGAAKRQVDADDGKREESPDGYLSELFTMLDGVVRSRPESVPGACEDDAEDPASVPVYWISKWVDYSDKYGLGYQVCDNSMGVLFNDSTRLLLFQNGDTVEYIERDGTEHFHTLGVFPGTMNKKIRLLRYFNEYMSEHLLKTGANITPREADEMSRLPFLKTWFRTRSAIILHLSNGTLQLNFFEDHTKVIVCPLMKAVTYINKDREFRTFQLSRLQHTGCNAELARRIRYALTMVERLIQSRSASAGRAKSAHPASSAQQQQQQPNNMQTS